MKSTGWPFTSTHSGSVKLFTLLTRLRTTSKISAQKLLNLRHRLWSWPMIAGNLEIEVPCTLPAGSGSRPAALKQRVEAAEALIQHLG